MMAVCLRYTGNTHDAKDILQQGFLRIFENISELNESAALEGWMKRIMVNASLDFLRRQKSGIVTIDFSVDYVLETQGHGMEPDDGFDEDDGVSKEDIMEAIKTLPDSYRTVFNLYVIEGMTHGEISKILNVSEGTSKSNLSKARAKLQDILKKDELKARYA
jgi:RNA polymerase sigma-70 factor (ECF subfamily)